MKPKKDNTKVIVVDADTLIKGLSVYVGENQNIIEDGTDIFYHQADEDLFREMGFPPGRTNNVNFTATIKWTAKNAQWQNSYLELHLISQKKQALGPGFRLK